MAIERVERRLAAVLAADVAGYSRLMGLDEEGTLARLKAVRKALVDPAIASPTRDFVSRSVAHGGRPDVARTAQFGEIDPARTSRSPLPFAYMIPSTAVFGEKFLSGEGRPV